MSNSENIYKLDGTVPLGQAIPFGLQHVLAMFVSNITPIIILAGVVGIDGGLSARLVQNAMIIAGIGTLIQLYPVWKIGSRLPIVMGISFTFLSLAIAIGTSQGMGTLMGAVIIGGIVEGLAGNPSTDYCAYTLQMHLNEYSSIRWEVGYASAIAVVLFLLTFCSNMLINKLIAKVGE